MEPEHIYTRLMTGEQAPHMNIRIGRESEKKKENTRPRPVFDWKQIQRLEIPKTFEKQYPVPLIVHEPPGQDICRYIYRPPRVRIDLTQENQASGPTNPRDEDRD